MARRKQMYADMQTLIHQEAGIGIPMYMSSLDGHSSKVKGLASPNTSGWKPNLEQTRPVA